MNERLKELMSAADKWANDHFTTEKNDWSDLYMEKFAKLLIEECVDELMYTARYHQVVTKNDDVVTAICESVENLREILEPDNE